jgi:hypothetical protein
VKMRGARTQQGTAIWTVRMRTKRWPAEWGSLGLLQTETVSSGGRAKDRCKERQNRATPVSSRTNDVRIMFSGQSQEFRHGLSVQWPQMTLPRDNGCRQGQTSTLRVSTLFCIVCMEQRKIFVYASKLCMPSTAARQRDDLLFICCCCLSCCCCCSCCSCLYSCLCCCSSCSPGYWALASVALPLVVAVAAAFDAVDVVMKCFRMIWTVPKPLAKSHFQQRFVFSPSHHGQVSAWLHGSRTKLAH